MTLAEIKNKADCLSKEYLDDIFMNLPAGYFNQIKLSFSLLRFSEIWELKRFEMIKRLNKKICKLIVNKKLKVYPKIDLIHSWPTNPLMDRLRTELEPLIDLEIKKQNLICDKKDALMQVLFRLTTFSVRYLFLEGKKVEKYILDSGCLKNWIDIPKLSINYLTSFKLNKNLIDKVIQEQLLIIKERLADSPLPIKEILSESGFFDGTWKLVKRNERIFAVKECNGKIIKEWEVFFKKVKPKIATYFHRDLHYIHTPRTKMAYGFFLKGINLPFSVEAIEPVDRPYKKIALIARGLDPLYCFELTRLYNWPGSPKNTTSLLDGLVFSLFKRLYPEIQAVITAIMPNYTLSKSQISGGIDDTLMIKPCNHMFIKRKIGKKIAYEHVTKRRLKEIKSDKIVYTHQSFPMLPVIELIKQLKKTNLKIFENKILTYGGKSDEGNNFCYK